MTETKPRATRKLTPFQEAMAIADEKRRLAAERASNPPAIAPEVASTPAPANTEQAIAIERASNQEGLARQIASTEDVLAIEPASTWNKLAPESASNVTPIAPSGASVPSVLPPEVASNRGVLSTGGKLEHAASTVARLLSPESASSRLVLAPPSASTPAKRRTFTPKHKTQFNVRIDRHLKAKLDLLAATLGKSMNDLAEEAFKLLLATPSATLLAPFDIDDDLIENPIIKLYCKYTGRPFTEKDKNDLLTVSHLNPLVIQIGMLTTLIRKQGGGISSFAYFVPEIQTTAEKYKEADKPEDYLKYLLKKVKDIYKR